MTTPTAPLDLDALEKRLKADLEATCPPGSHWANALVGRDDLRAVLRLIETQRELLAALKAVVFIADRKTDVFDAAHAAIAKAEG